jgi:hypothetical protein
MSVLPSHVSASALRQFPWGKVTVLVQLSLFVIPASTVSSSTLTATALIPPAALLVTLCVGGALLLSDASRNVGWRILGGTVVAAVLEVVLTLLLVAAYSSAHPGWHLS